MQIQDVEKLAEMAKLDLSNEEKESLLHDMEGILSYVKQIESVEVGDVNTNLDVYNVWREDLPMDRNFSRDSIVEQFPAQKDGFLKVKKIL